METILVTLDGSDLAAQAIPVASRVAGLLGACVRLLRVIPPVPDGEPAPGDLPALVDLEERQARADLERHTPAFDGVPVDLTVLVSDNPAQEIVRYLRESPVDFVVMATQLRSGLHQYVTGSVTEAVLRSGLAPVVAVRPTERPAVSAQRSATGGAGPLDGATAHAPLRWTPADR